MLFSQLEDAFSFVFSGFLHRCLQVTELYFSTATSEGFSSFFFLFFSLIVHFSQLFCGSKSSAKEPRQKETHHGDEFTRGKNSHQHFRQSIMVVLQTIASSAATEIKNHSSVSSLALSKNKDALHHGS